MNFWEETKRYGIFRTLRAVILKRWIDTYAGLNGFKSFILYERQVNVAIVEYLYQIMKG